MVCNLNIPKVETEQAGEKKNSKLFESIDSLKIASKCNEEI